MPSISGNQGAYSYPNTYELGDKDNVTTRGGNYVFTNGPYAGATIIYAGESEDIQNRVKEHLQPSSDKYSCLVRNLASHIWVHQNSKTKSGRIAEENDIKAAYACPCNG